jgi:murein DD-endopeptidase MepM/ murein hydrolase activator NlpD
VKLAPATTAPAADDARLREAARNMEAILLRQMLRSSGVYSGGEGPGASVREDLFVNALADAVESAGGMGIADTLVRAMGGAAAAAPNGGAAAPAAGPSPSLPPPRAVTPRVPTRASGPLPGEVLPLSGHVGSGFGLRTDPFTGQPRHHDGVDVGAAEGSPIVATADGVVRSAGPRGGYGNAVEIDHGNGLTTLYGHASELLVAPGQVVHAGQEIARVGSTGRSTGPHLHFEVRQGGRAVDPTRVLKIYASRAEEDLRSGP